MGFIKKYNCILCKYNKYNKDETFACFNYVEKDEQGYPKYKCPSLTNIYYGKIINHFPFKQIHKLSTKIDWWRESKRISKLEEKYGDFSLETDDLKFIWGVKSWDDLTGKSANLSTMNDIEIVYDKKNKDYMLGVETAYLFKSHESECKYLLDCLNAFTEYMERENLDINSSYTLFMGNVCTETRAKTIEELYTNFKIFVNGFCSLNTSGDGELNYD